ncbi:MAG TPA: right-handed parallel beta-helix repeat-containing protein, partial [Blastocatellia bacterium]
QAEFPRETVNTTTPAQTGKIISVLSGGDLQAALNAAQPGDTVEIAAGATFTGKFYFRDKVDNGKWIIVRSSRASELPEGQRVSPADAPKMARLVPNDNAHVFDFYPTSNGFTKARRWRFIGLEIMPNAKYQPNSNLIKLGTNGSWQTRSEQAPEDIIFDRCYMHGTATGEAFRAVTICATRTGIINCYLSDFHVRGFEAQAILIANAPGPILIENNYVEGAGENLMSGGVDLRIKDLVPSDITIRRNYFFKPMSWQGVWSVKNLFELKTGQRVLIEDNVFENNWVDGQAGWAILFTTRNQSGGNPWSAVRDVTFQNNTIRNVAGVFQILGRDYNYPSERTERIVIRGNTVDGYGSPELGTNGRFLTMVGDSKDVIVQNNSAISPDAITPVVFDGLPTSGFVFTDNIFSRGSFGVFGSGQSEGKASLDYYAPGYVFLRNVILGGASVAGRYPAGNYFTN